MSNITVGQVTFERQTTGDVLVYISIGEERFTYSVDRYDWDRVVDTMQQFQPPKVRS